MNKADSWFAAHNRTTAVHTNKNTSRQAQRMACCSSKFCLLSFCFWQGCSTREKNAMISAIFPNLRLFSKAMSRCVVVDEVVNRVHATGGYKRLQAELQAQLEQHPMFHALADKVRGSLNTAMQRHMAAATAPKSENQLRAALHRSFDKCVVVYLWLFCLCVLFVRVSAFCLSHLGVSYVVTLFFSPPTSLYQEVDRIGTGQRSETGCRHKSV